MNKIMFNDQYRLTDAVLSRGKTQTRRIIPKSFFSLMWDEREDTLVFENDFGDGIDIRHSAFAKYKVGDVVAVAQSYKDVDDFYRTAHIRRGSVHCVIVSSYNCVSRKEIHDWFFRLRKELKDSAAWTNKMFVRADLMPHRIRITDVRVERLQDISDEDCVKEGISYIMDAPFYLYGVHCDTGMICLGDTPREAYAALIDKISGKGTWESNPYVFVYDFELIK